VRTPRSTGGLALRAALATLYFAAVFFVALPAWILTWAGMAPPGGLPRALGGTAIALASAAVLWLVAVFVLRGRGTHVPLDPPRYLIAAGAYRWTRNPMYLLYVAILLGEALWFGSWALTGYALVFWLVFHAYVVKREEPLLRRRFGRDYETYCRTVPRWLSPTRAGTALSDRRRDAASR
jgi:protein-S-isoprenylcysteine O-methyltransferase Ste14